MQHNAQVAHSAQIAQANNIWATWAKQNFSLFRVISRLRQLMSVKSIIQTIEEMRNEISQNLPLSKRQIDIINKKFTLELLYNNKHKEGKTLTYTDEAINNVLDSENLTEEEREVVEMTASEIIYRYIYQVSHKDEILTEASINELHKLMLVKPYYKDAVTIDGKPTVKLISIGKYKSQPNNVELENGEIFYYATPIDTPMEMQELFSWYNNEGLELHPLIAASGFHYRFVRIHPFDDGNGRMSRLIMNYIFIKNNLPVVVIKNTERKNYLKALHLADNGNIEAFIEYIGEQLILSLELVLKVLRGESIEDHDDWKKRLTIIGKGYNTTLNITMYGTNK